MDTRTYRIVGRAKQLYLSYGPVFPIFSYFIQRGLPFYSRCDGEVLLTEVEYLPYFRRFVFEIRLVENMLWIWRHIYRAWLCYVRGERHLVLRGKGRWRMAILQRGFMADDVLSHLERSVFLKDQTEQVDLICNKSAVPDTGGSNPSRYTPLCWLSCSALFPRLLHCKLWDVRWSCSDSFINFPFIVRDFRFQKTFVLLGCSAAEVGSSLPTCARVTSQKNDGVCFKR